MKKITRFFALAVVSFSMVQAVTLPTGVSAKVSRQDMGWFAAGVVGAAVLYKLVSRSSEQVSKFWAITANEGGQDIANIRLATINTVSGLDVSTPPVSLLEQKIARTRTVTQPSRLLFCTREDTYIERSAALYAQEKDRDNVHPSGKTLPVDSLDDQVQQLKNNNRNTICIPVQNATDKPLNVRFSNSSESFALRAKEVSFSDFNQVYVQAPTQLQAEKLSSEYKRLPGSTYLAFLGAGVVVPLIARMVQKTT